MVSDPVVWDGVGVAAAVLDAFLPFAEAVQGLPSVVVDLQGWLQDRTHPSQFEHTEEELSAGWSVQRGDAEEGAPCQPQRARTRNPGMCVVT